MKILRLLSKKIILLVISSLLIFISQSYSEDDPVDIWSTEDQQDIKKKDNIIDSNLNKVCIFWRDQGNNLYGTGIVGTVSGTGISFGANKWTYNSATTVHQTAVFDSNSNKVDWSFYEKNGFLA